MPERQCVFGLWLDATKSPRHRRPRHSSAFLLEEYVPLVRTLVPSNGRGGPDPRELRISDESATSWVTNQRPAKWRPGSCIPYREWRLAGPSVTLGALTVMVKVRCLIEVFNGSFAAIHGDTNWLYSVTLCPAY